MKGIPLRQIREDNLDLLKSLREDEKTYLRLLGITSIITLYERSKSVPESFRSIFYDPDLVLDDIINTLSPEDRDLVDNPPSYFLGDE